MRIVTKAFLRYLLRRRSLSVLQLMGIACGVAAAVGMAFSSQTALSTFSKAVEFLKGQATHTLKRAAGPMDEALLTRVMRDPAVETFSPVIDRRIRLHNKNLIRVLGVDPFLDRDVRPEFARISFAEGSSEEEGLDFLLDKRAIIIDSRLQEELGLELNDELETSRGTLRIVGSFSNPSGEPLIFADIANAQEIFGLRGKIDYVDLILSDPSGFRARWDKGFVVESSGQQQATLGDMLTAFRLNLEALSLLALFVGVFLVYNTAMFTVISRRKDAGILRSLGATQREIVLAFLTELLLLGTLGGALGGALGYLLSRFLTGILGETISGLYFFLQPAPPIWSWAILLYGVLLGCGASLLGGFFPLLELVRAHPVKALHGRVAGGEGRAKSWKVALAGLAVLAISVVLFLLSATHVYFGFGGAFFLLVGTSLLTGVALMVLSPLLKRTLGYVGGLPGKVASENIHRNLGRTAVAIAAFMVALSMSVGLGSMIGSFRHSLVWWMNTQLRGDLYIAPSSEIEVPKEFYPEIQAIDGIGGIDIYRNVQIIYQGVPIRMSAVDPDPLKKFTNFGWMQGGNEHWDKVKQGAVIVSESFYRRFGVGPGESVILDGVEGPVELEIAAAFYDYTTEHGLIMMDRSNYVKIFDDQTIDSLAIFVDPTHAHRAKVIKHVREKASEWDLPVITQKELHGGILGVFDTTFAVTRSMRVLAIIVAFFGIAGAILILFMERQREFGIYRALGFSTPQVANMTLMEGLGMGLISFVLCIGVGTALAWVLIRVINLNSFNWTIFYHPEWQPYVMAAGIAVLASIGASIYPIWKICRTYPQMQIREE
jgi:putative ABC transport system permease protein